MKKFVTLLVASVFACCSLVTAQTASGYAAEALNSYSSIGTEIVEITDKYQELHPRAKLVTITLEHTPLTGEVRLYYKCMASSYDQGEAMNTALAVYEDFALENKYKARTYVSKDKTSYSKDERGIRQATYVSHVIFKK